MTPTDLARVKRIEYEGPGGPNQILFGTDSWSNEIDPETKQVKRYMLTADFNPDVGTIVCDCTDARVYRKWIGILTGEGQPCKHIRACHALCKKIMEQKP